MIMFIAWAPSSYGQPPTLSPYDISDSELDQRLKFIETRLVELNPKARYWQYGWTGFYAASAVGQAALAIDEDDSDDKTGYIVGAVKSTGGLVQMLLKPLPAVTSHDDFQSLPSQTRAERLLKLEQGEALLYENANRAQQRYGWKRHAIGIAANLLGGVIIATNGDSSDAVASTVLGIAVSEANIWTESSRAETDLNDYRSNFHDGQKTSEHNWHLVPSNGGMGVVLNISF
jgi:hypothetical protein